MKGAPLGKLEKLDVHDYWASEAQDFTPWLAREENIALLGEEIGIELEVQNVEQGVGSFRADIVCTDTVAGHKVLIENQLARTDHSHLGQILTYAAGLDAVVVVWIADHFREEHRATLDWLNRVTEKSLNFFGLEIELWRIGNSQPAVKFNAVVKPNEWTKPQPDPTGLSDTLLLYNDYWTAFREFASQSKSAVRVGQAFPQGWLTFPVGRGGFHLSATITKQKQLVYVQLVIAGEDRLAHFGLLKSESSDIEREFGDLLEWRELPNGKESHIRKVFKNVDPAKKSDWPRQHEMMLDALERLHQVFSKRVKSLDAADWPQEQIS